MSLHLITGYAGHEHITSADQGAYNAATFGSGQFVLDRGNKFAATAISNNSIQISDGEAMMKGRFIKMPSGTTETVTIENGSQGKYRNDLIVIRYEKSTSDNTESTILKVIKGTESSTTATDPSYTNGNITDGTDLVNDMPLYRVSLNGINVETITPLFSVKTSMVDYMDSYQLPIATSTTLGGVKVGDNMNLTADGKISLNKASTSQYGVMKVGNGLGVSNGVVYNNYSLPSASTTEKGGVVIGKGLTTDTNGSLRTKHLCNMYIQRVKEKVTISAHSYAIINVNTNYFCYMWSFSQYLIGNGCVIIKPAVVNTSEQEEYRTRITYYYAWNISNSSVTLEAGDTFGYLVVYD